MRCVSDQADPSNTTTWRRKRKHSKACISTFKQQDMLLHFFYQTVWFMELFWVNLLIEVAAVLIALYEQKNFLHYGQNEKYLGALTTCHIQPIHTHSNTDCSRCDARCQPANQDPIKAIHTHSSVMPPGVTYGEVSCTHILTCKLKSHRIKPQLCI